MVVGFDWVQVGLRLLLSPATSHVIVRTAWYVKLHHLFLYWGGSFLQACRSFWQACRFEGWSFFFGLKLELGIQSIGIYLYGLLHCEGQD
jgi:hypothetical protein